MTINDRSDLQLGAVYHESGRCTFTVWAPNAKSSVKLRMLNTATPVVVPLERVPVGLDNHGYWTATVDGVDSGTLYMYVLDDVLERPDPASKWQPQGVHGPSSMISTSNFQWTDQEWSGIPLDEYVLYELHVGTFTEEGTFDATIDHLDYLRALGITAVELMPVAQFPGGRNWGYDGVLPFAVQDTYGGPQGLARLVDACHTRGLAVVLDVVYNHLGPEGNHLRDFGPYFTDRYRTPWGEALNFDGPGNGHVRRYFVENALYWITDLHIDALRLDAVHAIADSSPVTFLEDLAAAVHERAHELSRNVYLIAESAANDARLILNRERGGYDLDAQWNDDFHHALRVALTGEQSGYYGDYDGVTDLARALTDGYAYSDRYSSYRRHRHGSVAKGLPADKFVVFAQNHDQVGNRMGGERLSALVNFDRLKLAAATVLLSPFVPLLFMGDEYGETAPFLYFISHSDHELADAVRRGRREEFASFAWQGEPPDPQAEETFLTSKLDDSLHEEDQHAKLLAFYKEVLRLRKGTPALADLSLDQTEPFADNERNLLTLLRGGEGRGYAFIALNFGDAPSDVIAPEAITPWRLAFDSNDARWGGQRARAEPIVDKGAQITIPATSALLFLRDG